MAAKQKIVTFEGELATFVKTLTQNMTAADNCARMALQHFKDHGDVVYMQRFFDAAKKNYVRRVAFVAWCMAHAPISCDKGKFSKDKNRGDEAFNLEAAFAIKFWDFKPETEERAFFADDVMAAFKKQIERFRKNDKLKPEAKKIVDAIETVIKIHEEKKAA